MMFFPLFRVLRKAWNAFFQPFRNFWECKYTILLFFCKPFTEILFVRPAVIIASNPVF